MNPQETQPIENQMTPDEAAASLGFATTLSDQMMQSQVPPVEPQGASQQEGSQETGNTEAVDIRAEIQGVEERLMETIESLREEIKSASPDKSRQEIESLKKQLSDILNEQDE